MINTEVEMDVDLEFDGEEEVEIIVIESDEEEEGKGERPQVLTPDDAFKLWEEEMKGENKTKEVEAEKKIETKEEDQEEEQSLERDLEEKKKPVEEEEEEEYEIEELPDIDEEAWSKYSHRLLRMLRHQIPNDYKTLQGPNGWVLLRDVNRAGIELTEEGSVALSVGIGGEGKIRFEIGETETGEKAIRLNREIEDNRKERKKWKDMVHKGQRGLKGLKRAQGAMVHKGQQGLNGNKVYRSWEK